MWSVTVSTDTQLDFYRTHLFRVAKQTASNNWITLKYLQRNLPLEVTNAWILPLTLNYFHSVSLLHFAPSACPHLQAPWQTSCHFYLPSATQPAAVPPIHKKVKGAILLEECRRGAHLPSVSHWAYRHVTHGQCNARPMVTFPAVRHHRPSTGTNLYCLVTEARVNNLPKVVTLRWNGRQ